LANVLPQFEVFVNIGTSHLKPDFPIMLLKSKKQFHYSS